MKLKNTVLTSLLMAIGLVLHQITPPIIGGMRPDFLLAMMFIAIFIDKSSKNAFLAGALAGIFAALTTTFPGGQIANLCDKIITAFVVLALVKAMENLNSKISVIVVSIVGTLVSGVLFLGIAFMIVGNLPIGFSTLLFTVVLPATVINVITTYICYNIVFSARKALYKA